MWCRLLVAGGACVSVWFGFASSSSAVCVFKCDIGHGDLGLLGITNWFGMVLRHLRVLCVFLKCGLSAMATWFCWESPLGRAAWFCGILYSSCVFFKCDLSAMVTRFLLLLTHLEFLFRYFFSNILLRLSVCIHLFFASFLPAGEECRVFFVLPCSFAALPLISV